MMGKTKIRIIALIFVTAGLDYTYAAAQDTKEPYVELRCLKTRTGDEIIGRNNTDADITVFLEVSGTNIKTSKSLPLGVTVPPKSDSSLVKILPKTEGEWEYEYEYKYGFGNLGAEHDDTYVYRLPYKGGHAYRVAQSFGGAYSHHEGLYYGVDFDMPRGEPVCAAREGVVVAVKSMSSEGGPEKAFKEKANFIYIRHADRTLGVYLHFKKAGVLVTEGQVVRRGQVIGLSGSTGWSTGAHLHFSVQKVFRSDALGESCPIQFKTKQGIVDFLSEGEAYEVD